MKITFSTGAGISVAAGLPTYRGAEGRYTEGSPNFLPPFEMTNRTTPAELIAACDKVRELRPSIENVQPTLAHKLIAELQHDHDVTVVTQNIDNLHVKAGSGNVIELHGNIFRDVWSENFECERVDVVFFGEQLDPNLMDAALTAVETCDVFVSVGTSGIVYPAAGLMDVAFERTWRTPSKIRTFHIDPQKPEVMWNQYITHLATTADDGMKKLVEILND